MQWKNDKDDRKCQIKMKKMKLTKKNKKELKKALPVGTVLTISAAGSEMSNSAVLTDEETQDKSGIGSDLIRPKFAIMNPKLTYTLPKYQLTC